MTDHTEKNRAVAEGLGYGFRKSTPWEDWDNPPKVRYVAIDKKKNEEAFFWHPFTNLQQALDHPGKALVAMGYEVCMKVGGDGRFFCWLLSKQIPVPNHKTMQFASEISLGHAICEVFLKVAERYPELLKEALERMAA